MGGCLSHGMRAARCLWKPCTGLLLHIKVKRGSSNQGEIDVVALLGFTTEVWDLGVPKNGQTPSFQFGLLLHRRARNSKLWRYQQDALAIGGGGGGAKTTT